MTKDMTTGSEKKLILNFMLPVLLGNLFQNFYSMVDSMIVGNYLGVDALAAIGLTGSINFLVVGWIIGFTSGFGILVSQAYGLKDERFLKECVAGSTYLCIGLAIIMTGGLVAANGWILRTMNTPADIFPDTYRYIEIVYWGLPATILYNMLSAIARALGDSKTPLIFLIISSVLNIVLDFLFVACLPFGVAGAAYATIISQIVSGILCLVYVYKKYPEIRFSREEGRVKLGILVQLLGIGVPMGLQFSITAIGTMIVQTSLNLLGPLHIAAYSAAMKIQNILIQIFVSLGATTATFVGQNYGAGKFDRIRKGVKDTIVISLILSAFVMAVAYYIGPYSVYLFAPDETGELMETARQALHTCLWFYPILSLIFIYRNALQGIGNGFIPMIGGIFELFARWFAIILLFGRFKYVGVCFSDPFAWVSALIPLIPYYYWYMRKKVKFQI